MSLLDRLFPKDEDVKPTSRLVQRGLEAIRLARDEQAVEMKSMRRAPSHFELRLSPGRLERLVGIDAVRDLEFYFRDELMRDLSTEGMRTFGDHTVRVEIGSDPNLSDNEMYAVVKKPDTGSGRKESRSPSAPSDRSEADRKTDATRVLAEEPEAGDDDATSVLAQEAPRAPWTLIVRWSDGRESEYELFDSRIVVGRRGATGRPLPEDYTKFSLDFPPTVSREQLQVEIRDDSILVQNIGKGSVTLADNSALHQGESRRIRIGDAVMLDSVSLSIESSNDRSDG